MVKNFKEKVKKDKLIAVVAAFMLASMIASGVFVNYCGKIKERASIRRTDFSKVIDKKIDNNNKKILEIKEVLKKDIERNARKQMRAELENSSRVIQSYVDECGNDLKSNKEFFLKRLKKYVFNEVTPRKSFSNQEESFALITIGGYSYFLVDNSNYCGEPKINGKNMIEIKNRTRSSFDEVVWQEELKYVLSEYKIIKTQLYSDNFAKLDINIKDEYDLDNRLSNTDVFRFKDLVYIKEKYPDVYKKIVELKVITHSDPESVEKFMNFVSYNRSSTEEDNCYWGTGKEKEILEVYVVPSGVLGFDKEYRTNGSGVFNENYVKISLVSKININKVYESFKETDSEIHNLLKESTELLELKTELSKELDREIKFINLVMVLFPLIASIAVILTGFSYIRVPTGIISQSFLDKYVCRHCENGIEDAPKPKVHGCEWEE